MTEETRAALHEWIAYQFRDLEKHGHISLQFTCTTESSRTETHGPIFDCHIRASATWLSKDMFMRTTGADYLGAAHECCHQIKEQMARQTKKLKTSRRPLRSQMRKTRGQPRYNKEESWDLAS